MFDILQYPDPRLKRVGRPVEKVDDSIRNIVARMFKTHYAAKNCAALAATQLDMPDPPHITVIDFSERKNSPLCLINAKIVASSGTVCEAEGCMSVSGVYEKVKRAACVTVEAINERGETLHFTAEGFMARCVQHELDHLAGKLFIDSLSPLKRARLLRKFKKTRKQL